MPAAITLMTPLASQYIGSLYENNFIPKPGPRMSASDQVNPDTPR